MVKIRIKNATIYGFGKWIDYSIDFSTESLVCVYGENESGKSTIHHFILFILFGLPPKQRTFYRPKTSGKMGGRLTVSDPEVGDYIIERMDEVKNGAAICYSSDGQEFDEEWLRKRLNGMTAEIYQSIFAFSALDLKDFQHMKDEDLGEILLGIGLTGSNNIYTIERRLDNKLAELFKPTGKNPSINRQLDSLDGLFTELTNYKSNEATYREKQAELTTIMNEVDRLQSELQLEKEMRLTIERHLNNLPTIYDYHTYYKKLVMYPDEIMFPEDGLERLSNLKEKLLPIKSELSVLHASQEKNELEQIKIKQELADKELYEEVKTILQEKQQYNVDKQDYLKQKEAIQKITYQIESDLKALNMGLSSENLAQITLPFYIEKTWNDLKNNVEKLQIGNEQLQHEKNTLEKQQSFLLNQEEVVKSELLTEERMEELHSQIDAYKEYDYLQKLDHESTLKREKWNKVKDKKSKNIRFFLIGSVILGFLLGITGLTLDVPFLYNVMVIVFVIGLGQWIWGKQSIKETTSLLINDTKIEVVSKVVTDAEKQVAEQLLVGHDENRNMLASIRDQLKSIDIQFIQWTEKSNRLIQQETRLTNQIEDQEAIYPFLQQIETAYWPEFYHTIKQLIEQQRKKETYIQQAEELKEKIESFGDTVQTFLEKVSRESIDHALELQLVIIENIERKYIDLQRRLVLSEEKTAEIIEQQTTIKQKMVIYNTEINKLFELAQVDNEDEFYKLAKLKDEKQLIEEKMLKNLHQLRTIFTHSDVEELIKTKPDQSRLEVNLQDSVNKINKYDVTIDEKRHQIAELNADLMNMESSESYSNTMHLYSMEKEELTELANEWAVLKTAKEMLVETKRDYRDKYLTRVINKTSEYFSKVTSNAYVNVIAPTSGKPFQVESIDQMRYQVNELSQGTIDQLYICLRLAISEIMSEKHHVPFIIDDAFVHFDGPRTKKVMEILSQIAKKQQIIIYTCKQKVTKSLPKSHIIFLTNYVRN